MPERSTIGISSALAALFHPEAVIIGSGGSQALEEWLATMRAPRAFPQSMHVIADPLIALGEDGTSADLDSYAVVFQLSDPTSGAADLTLGIRYLDHAVVHEGRWVLRAPAGHDPVDAVTASGSVSRPSCVGDDPGWRR